MVLDLRKLREIVQALLRAWNKKAGDDVLENVAQTSAASGDGSDGKPALAGAGFSSPSQPGVTTGDGAASQSPGTPSRPANVQTTHGRPFNAAGLRAVERATQLVSGGTGTHQRPEDTKKGLSDPRVHIDASRRRSWGHGRTAKTTPRAHGAGILRMADGEPDTAKKAPRQEKKLPEIRCKTPNEVNWQSRPLAGVAT